MKVATWNINGISSRLEHVVKWSLEERPDVLCLQETKVVDGRFPAGKLRAAGFPHIVALGEKAYNGVAVLSRSEPRDIQLNFPDDPPDAPKRLIAATIDDVRIVNVYIPHGTKFGSDKFRFKLDWIKRLRDYFDSNFDQSDEIVLCGDINVAPHELDVWNPMLWNNKMHFSRPEREAIMELKKWGFVDLFRHINGGEKEFSWWSNFHHDFEKDRGLRIDHIWASPAIAETCTDCWIDKTPRGWDKPSDHAPVLAQFEL